MNFDTRDVCPGDFLFSALGYYDTPTHVNFLIADLFILLSNYIQDWKEKIRYNKCWAMKNSMVSWLMFFLSRLISQ